MNMDVDAFNDSAVERAANQGGALLDMSQDWPPKHIVKYDYDGVLSAANSLVDMNLNEDDEPMLGDIKSAEEQPLVSGDIDMDPRYKQNNRNRNKSFLPNKNNKKFKNKKRDNMNKNMDMVINHGNGIKNALRKKMSSQTKSQKNIHRAPSSNLTMKSWCIDLFYWIPIRYLCFIGNMALFIFPFLDVRFQNNITFVQWLLYWYIQLFAIVAIFIESPTWILTRKIQLTIYKWCRILRRTWGRALFYISISLLTFAELKNEDGTTTITTSMFAGIYMTGMSFIMLLFSILAAKQYRLMYEYMASGGNPQRKDVKLVGDEYSENNNGNNIDDDKLQSRVMSYFNHLDSDGDGRIGAGELHQFAEEALNRSLSNSERYTLQTFLDCSCNGYITREDWTKQFFNYNKVSFL